MKREEILALNLQKGERVLVECDIYQVDSEGKSMTLRIGRNVDTFWMQNVAIHSIRRVSEPDPTQTETELAESSYVSLEDFHEQKAYERRIYAFNVAREFAERGEEMPDDLRNEIMAYISKSPEIEGIKTEEKIEVTEVEGIDYVLDIDGNQLRAGDKCERAIHSVEIFKGTLTVAKINGKNHIAVDKTPSSWNSLYFRKVN